MNSAALGLYCVPMLVSKLSQLRAAYESGDAIGALRIAAKFADLGEHREAITRAWAAHTSPAMYREMGRDPEAAIAAGIIALRARYALDSAPAHRP